VDDAISPQWQTCKEGALEDSSETLSWPHFLILPFGVVALLLLLHTPGLIPSALIIYVTVCSQCGSSASSVRIPRSSPRRNVRMAVTV
jgi:hypothetical protein